MQHSAQQVWFVTGASAGFGKSFVEYAVKQGHFVVATARSVDKLEALKALAPKQIDIIKMDVTKTADITSAVNQTLERFGRIDVLINNAGYGLVGAFEETSDELLREQMETNFFGAMTVIRSFLPQFRKQKSGAIVNVSSMGGQMSAPGYSAYSASKWAMEGASEALAQEMAPFHVKVLIAEPGSFRTEFAGSALKMAPEMDAYQSIVGPTRAGTKAHDKVQVGNPAKAAAAIDQAIRSAKTPLRIQLGADAIGAVKAHAENLLGDLKEWSQLGASTQFD